MLNRAGYWTLREWLVPKMYSAMIRWRSHNRNVETGTVLEHRLVMAKKIGRPLEDGEVVHHIDGDKQNNAPDNLELHGTPHSHNGITLAETHELMRLRRDNALLWALIRRLTE